MNNTPSLLRTDYRMGPMLTRLNSTRHRHRASCGTRPITTADGRLRLWGRLDEVCAALDRLCVLERHVG